MENNKDTALNGVKMMIADGIVSQEAAEKYFPELKEKDVIPLLEKQGETLSSFLSGFKKLRKE